MSVLVRIRDWWHAPVIERLNRIDERLRPPTIKISEPAINVIPDEGEWRFSMPPRDKAARY